MTIGKCFIKLTKAGLLKGYKELKSIISKNRCMRCLRDASITAEFSFFKFHYFNQFFSNFLIDLLL